jgi:quinolinate synthase
MDALQAIKSRIDLTPSEKEYRSQMVRDIFRLKEGTNSIILAHNYQRDEIQDVADLSGDSLALARYATKVDKSVIVLCGVRFMAESAVILNPAKTVLLPVKEAGCPMADMVTANDVKKLKSENPDAAAVCYVNTSADVKAECDICCTSSNAVKVVNSLKEEKVIFVPDRNLGHWVEKHTRKKMIIWQGYCLVHHFVHPQEIIKAKEKHPQAEVIAHPECTMDVLNLADQVCSTQGMLEYAKKSVKQEFIIVTEAGILYKLQKENPAKKFYFPSVNLMCANMKVTRLAQLKNALEKMVHRITVEPDIAAKAKMALDRMLAVS